ncbi:hypothetical protein ACQPWY_29455 [Pseudonocardia xinjiangensis]|uniref:hypothetical protein n=1 Tax=Pseudonocardia xinjiangensis TaxID=75289 RepID=UPI003D8CD31A
MTIAWGSLLVVAVGSVAVAVTVVSLVAFALVALSRCREEAAGGGTSTAGLVLAAGCLAGALVVVGYGLYVIAA